MLTFEKIDTNSKAQVNRFVRLPFRLYKNDPFWVPPILVDHEPQLNRKKHPFYEHSDADFFMAVRDGRNVGRVAAIENRRLSNQVTCPHFVQRTPKKWGFSSAILNLCALGLCLYFTRSTAKSGCGRCVSTRTASGRPGRRAAPAWHTAHRTAPLPGWPSR